MHKTLKNKCDCIQNSNTMLDHFYRIILEAADINKTVLKSLTN